MNRNSCISKNVTDSLGPWQPRHQGYSLADSGWHRKARESLCHGKRQRTATETLETPLSGLAPAGVRGKDGECLSHGAILVSSLPVLPAFSLVVHP